jgi:NAD-dependent SIR2 family protein deacetylase
METTNRCTKEGCTNYGNEKNNGLCNRCYHNWKPPGPNYTDKTVFPEPLTLHQLAIRENRPQEEIKAIKEVEEQRLKLLEQERQKNTERERNRVGVSLDDDFQNYYDPSEILDQKIDLLVRMIKAAKVIVVYTGAGISTSAGISDYRSWDGSWTAKLLHTKPKASKELDELRPTVAHMALHALVKQGIVKYIVSTNLDNLHRRSGVLSENLAELHGNCYKEICSKCSKEIFHPTRVRFSSDHFTGNKCPDCRGPMMDSIIHFGENLPEKDMKKASDFSKIADIALVLGSSMRVKPACWLTEYCYSFGNNGKIVICNLQKTDYESKSYLSIFNDTDTIMKMVMAKLGLDIPPYTVENDPTEQLKLTGINISTNDSLQTTGFAVDVSHSCSHIQSVSGNISNVLKYIKSLDVRVSCNACENYIENWLCLHCNSVACGRSISGHAESHYKTNNHSLVISLSDFSCWCYDCNSYIEDPLLNPLLFELHERKFSSPHPKKLLNKS